MVNRARKCIVALLSAVMATGTFAVTRRVEGSSDTISKAHVWTTYNSYYVLQDPKDMTAERTRGIAPTVLSEDDDLALNITMGRGELEAAQIIVTAGNTNISNIDIDVADLSNGENKITTDKMDIYLQFYVPVRGTRLLDPTTSYVPLGNYPDVLLPWEIAKNNGENKVKAGMNQGITIDIETAKDQVPGIYKGEFTLTVDGESQKVPVTVDVKDVDLSVSRFRSIGASAGVFNEKTYEMLLNKFRCLPQFPTGAAYSPERMVELVLKYWDNPHFCNYEIPNYSPQVFYKFVYALAQASTKEKNLLSRATCYMQELDETNDGAAAAEVVKTYKAQKDNIIGKLGQMFPNDEETQKVVKEAIEKIPLYIPLDNWFRNVMAADFDPAGSDITFCMAVSSTHIYEEMVDEFCGSSVQPHYLYSNCGFPGVAHSLSNYGTAIRYLAWIGMKYDAAGYLFWDMDAYRTFDVNSSDSNGYYRTRNYFEDGAVFYNSGTTEDYRSGNGMLLYPAKRWGEGEDQYGTLRLISFRDGVEDNELFYQLEQVYNDGLLTKYGIEGDFDDLVDWIYDQALNMGYYYTIEDGALVYKLREIVYQLLELAKSETKFVIGGITYENDQANVTLYADADSVKVNGQSVTAQTGDNDKYVTSFSVNEQPVMTIELNKGGKTYTFLGQVFQFGTLNKVDLSKYTNETITNVVTSSPASYNGGVAAGTVTVENDKLKINIPDGRGETLATIGYTPMFTINSGLFGTADFNDVYYICFKMRLKYGDSAVKKLPIEINMFSSASSEILGGLQLDDSYRSGDDWERNVVFKIARTDVLADIKRLEFTLRSYHSNLFIAGAQIEISDIYYTNFRQEESK